jgi:hypothetical protein
MKERRREEEKNKSESVSIETEKCEEQFIKYDLCMYLLGIIYSCV